MARLLHVAIGFATAPVSSAEIQKAFGSHGWARYAPNCWIVHTDEAPQALADRVRERVKNEDSIFVCELSIANNGGYLHKEIWDWINKTRHLL